MGKRFRWLVFVLILALIVPQGSMAASKLDINSNRKAALDTWTLEELCFDPVFYANNNYDILVICGNDAASLYSHWKNYGIAEGRASSPIWDPRYYLQQNSDIKAQCGNNYEAALSHFQNYGYKEGRVSSKYYYGKKYKENYYSEFKNYSYLELLGHFKNYGFKEGRYGNTEIYKGYSGWGSPQPPYYNPTMKIEAATNNITTDAGGDSLSVWIDTYNSGGFSAYTNETWIKIGKRKADSTNVSFDDSGDLRVQIDKNTSADLRTGKIYVQHSTKMVSTVITVKQNGAKNNLQEVIPVTPTPTPVYSTNDTQFIPDTSTPTPTPTPTPRVTPTPTPRVTPTPSPVVTRMPSPGVTPTPASGNTQNTRLQMEVKPEKLTTDSNGNFADNKASVSATGADSIIVEADGYSWLKVCKNNNVTSALSKIVFLKEDYGSFYVFADKNTTSSSRTGYITVTAGKNGKTETKKIEVRQEYQETKLTVSNSKITANAKGITSVASVKVQTNSTGGFTVDSGNSWIKIGNSSSKQDASYNVSYKTDGIFYVFLTENTSDSARTGTITVRHEEGNLKETIKVSQEGIKSVLEIDSTNRTADSNGVFFNNAIKVKTSNTGYFTVVSESPGWLRVSYGDTSSFSDGLSEITLYEDSYIYLVADKNTGGSRTAVITVTHESGKLSKEITVTQAGKESAYLQVDRERADFDEPVQGISEAVKVYADEATKWTADASDSWIKVLKDETASKGQYVSVEGAGNGKFYILVKDNNTHEERNGYVTISAPGVESYRIEVSQAESEISDEDLLAELSIRITKKTFKKGKTSKIKLDYPEGLYPSDIKKVTYSSSKTKVANVNSKGVVKGVKKGKAVITVKVTLENGSSKTFKVKIIVDKRKVKLSKMK